MPWPGLAATAPSAVVGGPALQGERAYKDVWVPCGQAESIVTIQTQRLSSSLFPFRQASHIRPFHISLRGFFESGSFSHPSSSVYYQLRLPYQNRFTSPQTTSIFTPTTHFSNQLNGWPRRLQLKQLPSIPQGLQPNNRQQAQRASSITFLPSTTPISQAAPFQTPETRPT
jgi:hypothetical protein